MGDGRLVAFQRPPTKPPGDGGSTTEPAGRFDLLGFTLVWARSRRGSWAIKMRTAKDRLSRALKAIRALCRRQRHEPIGAQSKALGQRMRGHYAYFGLVGNRPALSRFADEVKRIWRRGLGRRGSGPMNWDRFNAILARFPLPPPRMPKRHAASL